MKKPTFKEIVENFQDLRHAVDRVNDLREQFPNSKLLEKMYFKFEYKRMKLETTIS